jgi:DNA polymerase-1
MNSVKPLRAEKNVGPRLLLVDGHGYAYRAFHAINGLKSPAGQPTNAIFGFIKMFEKARGLAEPTHVAVVWDGGLDQERVESLPDYKGQRAEMPDDLEVQLDEIDAYLEAAGILSVCHDGVEADDLIAAVAAEASRASWNVVIATNDKDFMQLVSGRVQMLNPGDKLQPLWDEARVMEKTGVRPDQVVDWLSLVGDAVDNIEGVRGVGPKTAAKLLNEFGTVDDLYEGLDGLKSERLRSVFAEAQGTVFRNRALVTLKTGVSGAPAIGDCAIGDGDRARMGELLNSWGFKSMAKAHAGLSGEQTQFF